MDFINDQIKKIDGKNSTKFLNFAEKNFKFASENANFFLGIFFLILWTLTIFWLLRHYFFSRLYSDDESDGSDGSENSGETQILEI